MNKSLKIFLIMFAAIFLIGCGGGDPEDAEVNAVAEAFVGSGELASKRDAICIVHAMKKAASEKEWAMIVDHALERDIESSSNMADDLESMAESMASNMVDDLESMAESMANAESAEDGYATMDAMNEIYEEMAMNFEDLMVISQLQLKAAVSCGLSLE